MNEKCEEVKLKYYTCLNNSKRNPSKCKYIETELRECSKTTGESYCIDEINNLMECSRSPDSSVCAKDFFLFRECNRPDGPHMLMEDNKYVIATKHLDKYNVNNAIIGLADAPERNNTNTASFLQKMKETLHLKNFKEKFVAYKW
ncbi:ATP synthase-associated protein [Plasmodium brasilianum]|uniref:Uncharacterized protein n=2 Tax=Plasmodium (Plasmodium) TaxID=418103 RepID=A0A1A8WD57_PLAMA|nr:conserved Plasmodium protein, unknown function [Plasmodium malariae]KAI4835821.1 ATP synthase-associated protein [Plasmodium brasilianum]SBS89668.1 conserved Plasmodium protein, unknown function [Plasmodium malariae]SCP02758.1 conserved Plasmodium protein, unknown function [Plasmodium malariae]